MGIITYFNRKPKSFLMALGIILVILIGIVNYIEAVMTKGELSFSIFYLLPIFLVAWFVNIKAGIVVSFLSAIVWEVTDFMAGHPYPNPVIPYWNTAVRLGFFLIVVMMLSSLRTLTSKLSKNVEQLEREITERTKAQEALNKQRERFISVLIHDLKG